MKPGRKKTKKMVGRDRFSLTIYVSVFVFIILLTAIGITFGAIWLMDYLGVIQSKRGSMPDTMELIIYLAVSSLILGFGISLLTIRIPLKPVSTLVYQMNRLASGDFKARIDFPRLLGRHPVFSEIEDSFNTMAKELEGTEMIQTDFINNFSHEFKTPIVSIAGFAKLLKREDLTKEQQMEYISIIESESRRLADMATNVLNLTKIENQEILTDVSTYNLSEQIRSCFLLLEKKWSDKNLELNLDFDEYTVTGNEELLMQVWINLVDNAIKFTPENGSISVNICHEDSEVRVSVSNTGSYIPPEKIDKVFNKFYKADDSRSTPGNGIGLAVVNKIVSLHTGKISVQSMENSTTFTVYLPDFS